MNCLIGPIISHLLYFTNCKFQPLGDSVLLPGLCFSYRCHWLKNAIQKCIWSILRSPRFKSAHCRYSIIIKTVVVCFAQHGSSHCDYIAEEGTCHMELLLAVTGCQGFLQIGCCSYECVEKMTNPILKCIIFSFVCPNPNFRNKTLQPKEVKKIFTGSGNRFRITLEVFGATWRNLFIPSWCFRVKLFCCC